MARAFDPKTIGSESGNGRGAGAAVNGRSLRAAAIRAAASVLVERAELGLSFAGKRDLKKALGYPDKLEAKDYRQRYDRGGIAERIVEAYPRATWGGGVDLQDSPDPEALTKFEQDVEALDKRLGLWTRLMRADILAGLGEYGLLLIGAPGELNQELGRISGGPDGVLYLTPLSQSRATIDKWDEDAASPRFGRPLEYKVQLSDKLTKPVHWTRVIHIAEGTLEDDVLGKPRLRSVWNYLEDLDKIVGGGAEGTWRRVETGMQVDIDPTLELGTEEQDALQDQVDEYVHGFRRVLQTRGTKINQFSASIQAFGDNADAVLDLISGTTGIPKRILLGSERGELASSQDRFNWSDRIAERRREFAEPALRELISRLVEAGALSAPGKEGYEVVWPTRDELDETEKAEVAGKLADANAKMKAAGDTSLVTSAEIRDRILGLEPLEEADTGGEDGDEGGGEGGGDGEEPPPANGEPPPANEPTEAQRGARAAAPAEPDWKAVHKAADSHRARLMALMITILLTIAGRMEGAELERAIEMGNRTAVERLAVEAAHAVLADAEPELVQILGSTARDAARAIFDRAAKPGGSLAPRQAAIGADLKFNLVNINAVTWAGRWGADLVAAIEAQTRDVIRILIKEGLSGSMTKDQVIKNIQSFITLRPDQSERIFETIAKMNRAMPGDIVSVGGRDMKAGDNGFSFVEIEDARRDLTDRALRDRAELIAHTETQRAANQGLVELWQQAVATGELDPGSQRVWIVTPDDRLCPECEALEGAIAPIDGEFEGGYDGPPAHPACRCAQGIASQEDIDNWAAHKAEQAEVEAAAEPEAAEPITDWEAPGSGDWERQQILQDLLVRNEDVYDHGVRGAIKAQLVEDIATRMLATNPAISGAMTDYEMKSEISRLIKQWAVSSGDSEPLSVALQYAARREFGLEAAEIAHMDGAAAPARRLLAGPTSFSNSNTRETFMRAFLRAQYDNTQALFAREGITEIVVSRGAYYPGTVAGTGGASTVSLQPLSSFSTNLGTAHGSFGSTVHFVKVPVTSVLSTFRTGFGCAHEYEVVLLGGMKTITYNSYTFTWYGSYTDAAIRAVAKMFDLKFGTAEWDRLATAMRK